MSLPVRVAAVGVNHWHSLYDLAYLPQLQASPTAALVGIQDSDPGILAERLEALGGGIAIYDNYPDMLTELEPDLVLVLDRHDRMGAIVEHLLAREIPFIVEKPASFNARELLPLAERGRVGHTFAAVPLFQRFSPFIQHARTLAEDGSLGAVRHFYYRLNRPGFARYHQWGSPWMVDPARSNGGCLRNLGNHGFDCFAYLTGEGENIDVTSAQLAWNTHHERVEDYATVLLKTGGGALATIEVGNVFPSPGRDSEMKVDFEKGILKTENGAVRLYTSEGVRTLSTAPTAPQATLEPWIQALGHGGKAPVGLWDCYLAVRLIDLAYLAAGNPYGTAAV